MNRSDLAHFIGTQTWYRHPFVRFASYTEGIKYLAEKAGAYWLIDEILFRQVRPKFYVHKFQLWEFKLTGKMKNAGVLKCYDGNGKEKVNTVVTKRIEYTDFPFDIELYFTNNVLMLKSEY